MQWLRCRLTPTTWPLKKWLKELLLIGVMTVVLVWAVGWARANLGVTNSVDTLPIAISAPRLATDNGAVTPLINPDGNQLLYLFAPWCSICQITFPSLAELDDDHRIITLALSYQNLSEVQRFVDEAGGVRLSPTVLLGDQHLSQLLSVNLFPTYLVVSPQGEILSKRVGYMPQWMLRLYLRYWQT
ncbi:TlpA family protein disulfide reductase [Ferrimonas senticii]|uniref:TlpA family protein disulfide reductase n=1 Tax=Ferrimonas senticii TaxID=394566 RepID=UPI000484143B|nr:hypothetical protein [Ferrimonas senticii]